ncbi:MAG TPA: prephenate dehydrogenase/arogenate dehydrogenase family protein [Terriglobia bacterium]
MNASTNPFHRVALIGVGLIGGSWGLALKHRGFAGRIVGCDRPQVLDRALELGAIDEAEPDLAASVRGAGLVILAAPVAAILEQLPQIKEVASPQAMVTDTGSTKRAILARARMIFGEEPLFLGAHPLAGKEQSGIENANASLFESARYVVTPLAPSHLQDQRVEALLAMVRGVGARPFVTDADTHDRALALLSHLPQLVSTGLASLIAAEDHRHTLPLELAAAGFRDMTRLAESPYAVWHDVCLTNGDNLRPAIDSLIRKLEAMKERLGNDGLKQEFDEALKLRDQWRKTR